MVLNESHIVAVILSIVYSFASPSLLQHFLRSGNFDVRKPVVQRLVVGEVKDPVSHPQAKDGIKLLRPLLGKVRVCSDLSWELGDPARLELLHAIINDGKFLS